MDIPCSMLFGADRQRPRSFARYSLGHALLLLCCGLIGCSWTAEGPFTTALAASIADLELNLRDDPYRSFAHLTDDGRNVFDLARWKLERLQRQRDRAPEEWSGDDQVLEFARARTLERLHLYRDAADAYARVSARTSRLSEPAARARSTMQRFAAKVRPLAASSAEEQLAEIDSRIAEWTGLARGEPDPGYASLAREEAEGWAMRRVELLASERGSDEAILACVQLLEDHQDSKLYPRHLLRFAALHAEAARQELIRIRTEHTPLGESRYEKHFEEALSAYELASETRNPLLRREAQSRLQALLLFHDEVLSGVY
jgi:hypothetical protein